MLPLLLDSGPGDVQDVRDLSLGKTTTGAELYDIRLSLVRESRGLESVVLRLVAEGRSGEPFEIFIDQREKLVQLWPPPLVAPLQQTARSLVWHITTGNHLGL